MKGQTLVVVALCLTALILFVGLAVDVANLMARQSKLQSAVDAAALSAAQMLSGTNITQTASTKAYQMLETNGVLSNTLNTAQTQITFPGSNQVSIRAVQRVDTFFMRLIPAFSTMEISSQATADLNSYAEINIKPYGVVGVVSELNISVWGRYSWRGGGDAYSPQYDYNGGVIANPEYSKQPYGYLYRVDVPASYSSNDLVVEIFDADSYNRSDTPPAWPTPYACPGLQCGSPTPTPTLNAYASCTNPATGLCTSNDPRYNTGLKLNAFSNGRVAFWRTDETRTYYNVGTGIGNVYSDTNTTETRYTLWHFNPRVTTAFDNPDTLSDQPVNTTYGCGNGSNGLQKCIAQYIGRLQTKTDLRWYQPPGFKITLKNAACTQYPNNDCFERESTGGMYFYLYVQGTDGSSENNFDLRVGPSHANACDDANIGADYTGACYANQQNYSNSGWNSGGATVFAKAAMPLNLDTGTQFPMLFTQVSKNAAGQVLGIRHFDQDCGGSNPPCGQVMNYQMQKCGCNDLQNPDGHCFVTLANSTGYFGPQDGWYCSGCPQPETVQIPYEGTTDYNTVFGTGGSCSSSWLRLQSDPSYSQDTTVWEMPYIRPRLIR